MSPKRYAPFAAVVLAQLAVVALAPSRAPQSVDQFAGGGDSSFSAPGGSDGTDPFAATDPGTGPGTDPSTPGSVGGDPAAGGGGSDPAAGGGGATTPGGPDAGPGQAGGGGTGPAPAGKAPATQAAAKGDTKHCVNGRQFGDYSSAPPCQPTFSGDNGGSTYAGVSGKTINLVYFREKDNPVVKSILQSQGLYSDPADQMKFMAATEDFINKKYELYGRKVKISFWSSPCQAAPPDDSCFRNDARALVKKEKPFAVVYDNNYNTASFFDELSKLRVINFGGGHFQDSFSTSHRPYHWDAQMGGDFQAQLTGDYWCKKLAGNKARYAGDATLRSATRKAGVFYPATDVNTEPARRLQSILKGCGTDVVDVPYSPDTATANQQATSQVAKLKGANVTSVLIYGDAIAPTFFTTAMTQQAYFPEHVLVGSGLIDYDKLGRLYDPQQWKHAFGVSDLAVYPAFDKQECSIMWRAAGRSGVPYSSAQLPWSYWTLVATGIQLAGPKLDPGTFEQALLSGRGDTQQYAKSKNPFVAWTHFTRGDYTAASDAKESSWDANATSPIDGKKGAYVHLNKGARYAIGSWPKGESKFPITP